MHLRFTAPAAAALLLCASARAADTVLTWIGNENLWTDPQGGATTNTPANNVPAGATYALIIPGGNLTVSSANSVINALTISGSNEISAKAVVVKDLFVNGGFTVLNSADISGNLQLHDINLYFNGTATIGASLPTVIEGSGSSAVLTNNGTMTIGNQTSFQGGLVLINNGLLDISAGGYLPFSYPSSIENDATLRLHSGSITSARTNSGSFSIDAGATLTGNYSTFTASSSITGQGNFDPGLSSTIQGAFNISGNTTVSVFSALDFQTAAHTGSLTLAGPLSSSSSITVDGPFTATGGTLTATGSVTVNGPVSISSGAFNAAGGLIINGNTTLQQSSQDFIVIGGSLTNQAGRTLTLSTPLEYPHDGTIGLSQSSTLINSGLFNTGPGAITADYSAQSHATFRNAGTLTVNAPHDAFKILNGYYTPLTFINTGTLTVSAGTCRIAAPQDPATTGIFNVNAGATLEFSANYDFSSPTDPTLTGAGLLIIDPGITLALPVDSAFSGTIEVNGTLLLTAPRDPNSTLTSPNFTVLNTPVPEPASLTLLAVGATALFRRRRIPRRAIHRP
ncbi:MAG TPA: PEP-CTERM sorting domain-containing protein [Phycisphaerae bacterium]|nr:PEP-CTERM sorting domain-containing protein [Phycisphaerae bacterium]